MWLVLFRTNPAVFLDDLISVGEGVDPAVGDDLVAVDESLLGAGLEQSVQGLPLCLLCRATDIQGEKKPHTSETKLSEG